MDNKHEKLEVRVKKKAQRAKFQKKISNLAYRISAQNNHILLSDNLKSPSNFAN